jgi:hypothetical protein
MEDTTSGAFIPFPNFVTVRNAILDKLISWMPWIRAIRMGTFALRFRFALVIAALFPPFFQIGFRWPIVRLINLYAIETSEALD